MRRPQNLKKSPTFFDKTTVSTQQLQNRWEIISNFSSRSRKAELYSTTEVMLSSNKPTFLRQIPCYCLTCKFQHATSKQQVQFKLSSHDRLDLLKQLMSTLEYPLSFHSLVTWLRSNNSIFKLAELLRTKIGKVHIF